VQKRSDAEILRLLVKLTLSLLLLSRLIRLFLARFRIKKKQRTTNLERSVSDLTGRAEDLEREAADLRRENGWLKEIVMLKGSRLAGVKLASHMTQSSTQRSGEGQQSNVSHRPDAAGVDSEDEGSSNSEEENVSAVGKSKKQKGRKK
jgi:hypothetical protein